MSRWFRSYADTHRNPKVAKLSDSDFRLWHELLCVAAENDGTIPPAEDLKHLLKRRLDHLSCALKRLISGGLIDQLEDGYVPRNWNERQYKSDTSTERVKKHREKRNVSVTPPETDTDTEVSEAKASSTKRAKKTEWHPLPAGWVPTQALSPNTQSMVENWPPGSFEAELESFRAWAANAKPEKGKGLKKDWNDAFGNWIRSAHRDRYARIVSMERHRGRANPLVDLYRAATDAENRQDHYRNRPALPPAGNG